MDGCLLPRFSPWQAASTWLHPLSALVLLTKHQLAPAFHVPQPLALLVSPSVGVVTVLLPPAQVPFTPILLLYPSHIFEV